MTDMRNTLYDKEGVVRAGSATNDDTEEDLNCNIVSKVTVDSVSVTDVETVKQPGIDVSFDELSDDNSEQGNSNWVHILERFWVNALASKHPTIRTICVKYCDMDQHEEEQVVECSIGKLMVGGMGNTKDIAREKAAQNMYRMIETILENEGTDTLKKNIIEGIDSGEASPNFSTVSTDTNVSFDKLSDDNSGEGSGEPYRDGGEISNNADNSGLDFICKRLGLSSDLYSKSSFLKVQDPGQTTQRKTNLKRKVKETDGCDKVNESIEDGEILDDERAHIGRIYVRTTGILKDEVLQSKKRK